MEPAVEKLVNHCLDMAEELLIEQGEFYPFGATINNFGELKNVGLFDGDDFPISDVVIEKLKEGFESDIKNGEIQSYAICFDCRASKKTTSEKTDAVAMECYIRHTEQRITYYYPYDSVTYTGLDYGEAWGIISE